MQARELPALLVTRAHAHPFVHRDGVLDAHCSARSDAGTGSSPASGAAPAFRRLPCGLSRQRLWARRRVPLWLSGLCLLRSPPAPSGPEGGGALSPESCHPDRRRPGSGDKLGSCPLLPGGAGDGQKGVGPGLPASCLLCCSLEMCATFHVRDEEVVGPVTRSRSVSWWEPSATGGGLGFELRPFLLPQKLKL